MVEYVRQIVKKLTDCVMGNALKDFGVWGGHLGNVMMAMIDVMTMEQVYGIGALITLTPGLYGKMYGIGHIVLMGKKDVNKIHIIFRQWLG